MVDRPLECSSCQKAVAVLYKEIKDKTITCYSMCQDCPILASRLYLDKERKQEEGLEHQRRVVCSKCSTSFEAVERGEMLGCSECYQVFANLILSFLISLKRIPEHLKDALKNSEFTLHIGKRPKDKKEKNTSLELASLTEALNSAIAKENYEQAAWLRDQIATLKGQNNGRKN